MLNVIILTYNNLNSTKKCLKNLYAYTKDFNLVVIDNNSTDDTFSFLQNSDKDFKLIGLPENEGIIKGRNRGYMVSNSMFRDPEYIMFLDNDQFVLPDWQESYMELFEQGYDLIGKEAWRMRREDFYPYKRITDKDEEFDYVGAGGLMLRASVLKELKGFDERYERVYFEDPDLCWEAHKVGYKVGWNHNNVIEHQKHNLSLSGERRKYFMQNWKKFREKWAGTEMPVFKIN